MRRCSTLTSISCQSPRPQGEHGEDDVTGEIDTFDQRAIVLVHLDGEFEPGSVDDQRGANITTGNADEADLAGEVGRRRPGDAGEVVGEDVGADVVQVEANRRFHHDGRSVGERSDYLVLA